MATSDKLFCTYAVLAQFVELSLVIFVGHRIFLKSFSPSMFWLLTKSTKAFVLLTDKYKLSVIALVTS